MKKIYLLKKYKHWFIDNVQGITTIEYAIIAAGIAVIVSTIFTNDGIEERAIKNVFDALGHKLANFVA